MAPKDKIYIAGIDSATSTGWSIISIDPKTETRILELYGKESFKPRNGESSAMAFIKFNTWIYNFITQKPQLAMIAFEMPMVRYPGAARITMGMATRIEEACERAKMPMCSFKATEIKKFATGKGNCGKPDMVKAANKKWGLNLKHSDDDIADAIHIAHMAINEYGKGLLK